MRTLARKPLPAHCWRAAVLRPSMSQRGQSLTELAISLVILLTLLAGVLDIGRAYYMFLSLRDAAAEGAAYGSFDPTNTTEIEARVRHESPGGMINWSGASISTSIIGQPCRGGGIEVSATVDYLLLTPFIGAIAGSQTLPLTAKVVNTILSPACP